MAAGGEISDGRLPFNLLSTSARCRSWVLHMKTSNSSLRGEKTILGCRVFLAKMDHGVGEGRGSKQEGKEGGLPQVRRSLGWDWR